MAPVNLKFVVSFTSQDDHHRVSNLTKSEGVIKKWLSHHNNRTGQIEAVFQLNEDCVISSMDIGVEWCASLEVLVGRSDWPQDRKYLTILPTVSFMNPVECRTGTNHTRSRMFNNEDLSEDLRQQKWDRIQVICRQPFRKDVQFGLCFFRIYSKDVKTDGHNDKLDKTKSVRSIQKHFFGRTFQSKSSADVLKSRLMKIAGSSEHGTEHHDALSRTAKLVLAASEAKNTPKLKDNPGNRPALFSNHLIQKYGPQFEEEVADFLSSFEIDKDELDRVTIADIRHKFEKLKKRKLTQEEKKIFVKFARDHICEKFSNENSGETNVSEATQSDTSKSDLVRLKPNKYGYNWQRESTLSPVSKDFKQKLTPDWKRNVMKENENSSSNEIILKKNIKNGQDMFSKKNLVDDSSSLTVSKSSEYRKCFNDPDGIKVTKVKKNGPLHGNSFSPAVDSPCLKSTNDEWLSSASPRTDVIIKETKNHPTRKRLLSGDSPNGNGKRSRCGSNDNKKEVNASTRRGRGRKNASQRGDHGPGGVCGHGDPHERGRAATKISNIQISNMETSGVGSCQSSSVLSQSSRYSCTTVGSSSMNNGSGYSSPTSTPSSVNERSRHSGLNDIPSSVNAGSLYSQSESTFVDDDDYVSAIVPDNRYSNTPDFVECPICCEFFSQDDIELHAQICCELNFN